MPSDGKTSTIESAVLIPPVGAYYDEHLLGPETARVTLTQYGDYECPHCRKAYYAIKGVQRELGDTLRFAFRNFPLSTIHPHAEKAVEAAEAAGEQGKFWEMHDLLYENQDRLDLASILAFAGDLGLDVPLFEEELAAGTYRDKIRRGFMNGIESGVNATPTLFINGIRYNGPHDTVSLLTALKATLLY